jgi:hypothetical protein
MLRIRILCLFDPWIQDQNGCKIMNNPDQISESLKKIIWVKILIFFNADPGWEKFGSGREKFVSGIRD